MKKRIVAMTMLVALASFTLIGCGSNPANADDILEAETGLSEDFEEAENDFTEDDSYLDGEVQGDDIDPEDEDPLGALRVDDSYAENHGGLYLVRNGYMYTLNGDMIADNSYEVGQRLKPDNYTSSLYQYIGGKGTDVITMGDVPLITLEADDEIRGYQIDFVDLVDTEFESYSIRAFEYLYGSIEIYPYQDAEPIILDGNAVDLFTVKDSSGNVVDDYRNLEYGETYTVSWYENTTEYHEADMVANCRRYDSTDVPLGGEYDYRLRAELTEYNYSLFDFSELGSGTYYIHNLKTSDGLIKIP